MVSAAVKAIGVISTITGFYDFVTQFKQTVELENNLSFNLFTASSTSNIAGGVNRPIILTTDNSTMVQSLYLPGEGEFGRLSAGTVISEEYVGAPKQNVWLYLMAFAPTEQESNFCFTHLAFSDVGGNNYLFQADLAEKCLLTENLETADGILTISGRPRKVRCTTITSNPNRVELDESAGNVLLNEINGLKVNLLALAGYYNNEPNFDMCNYIERITSESMIEISGTAQSLQNGPILPTGDRKHKLPAVCLYGDTANAYDMCLELFRSRNGFEMDEIYN